MRKGFPDNFLWGGAIAASQADGAYDEGERGLIPRIYDILTRRGQRKSGQCLKTAV